MCVCAKNAASTRILQNTVVVEEAIVKRDPHKNHHHHHKKYVVTILFKPYNVVTVLSFNKKLVLEVYSVHNNNPSHLIFWKHAEYKKSPKGCCQPPKDYDNVCPFICFIQFPFYRLRISSSLNTDYTDIHVSVMDMMMFHFERYCAE